MLSWDPDQCAFIHQASAEQVCKALIELCAAEGMFLTAEQVQPEHVAPTVEINEWKFQILPGNGDWTLIRCSPRYALVEKPMHSTSPRFLTLCESLSTFGFILMATNYQRQAGWVLLEAERTGRQFLSGYWLDNLETSEGKDFFGYALDTADSPWKITPRSSTLLTLLSKANSPDIQATLDGSTTTEGVTLFSAMLNDLPRLLTNFENYEVTRDFEATGGTTLNFKRSNA